MSGGNQWDTVVSVAELIRFPDLTASLNAIDALLAPGGRLLAIEPVVRPGTLRVFGLAPWSITRSVRRFHVGRDLTAALRTTPLVNDDIDRFTLPTAVVPLRHFVSVGARRVVTVPEVQQGPDHSHVLAEENFRKDARSTRDFSPQLVQPK